MRSPRPAARGLLRLLFSRGLAIAALPATLIWLLSIPDAFLFPRTRRIWRTSSVLSRTFVLHLKCATTTNTPSPKLLRPPANRLGGMAAVDGARRLAGVARAQVVGGVAAPEEPTRSAHGGTAMLGLARKVGETIVMAGDICVTVVAIEGNRTRLGITAPASTRVDREEVHQRLQEFRSRSPVLPI